MTGLAHPLDDSPQLLDAAAVQRITLRLAHEIAERHPALDSVVLVGHPHPRCAAGSRGGAPAREPGAHGRRPLPHSTRARIAMTGRARRRRMRPSTTSMAVRRRASTARW